MIEISKSEINSIAQYLMEGNLVAIPTETVYGIAISCDNSLALSKLIIAKERENKPFSIMVSTKEDINKFAEINLLSQRIINNFLPGELTIVLNKKGELSSKITGGLPTIGIRLPNDEFLKSLIDLTGPLVVTSANRKGEKTCSTSEEIKTELPFIDVVVTGECSNNIPTTVVSIIENKIKILRTGKIKLEDLLK